MTTDQEPLDVAKIMREIRSGTRGRHEEIASRIARAHKQIEEQMPQVFDNRLSRLVQSRSEMFGRYYERMLTYLAEQEPNYVNVRRTLTEINRLVEEPLQPPGHRDRWWNPRTWLKRLLTPLRRYIMRRQYDLNSMMRDTLVYLFNHSAHIETQRLELEMGVQLMQAMEALLEQMTLSRRYLQEWLRVSLPPFADYVEEVQRHSMDRQAEALTGLQASVARQLDQFTEDWGIRLGEMSRRMTDTPANTAAALVGFDSLRLADLLRGSPEEVRRQQARYVPYLGGQENILDAGCGRGEFLDILRQNGFSAYGVDSDENMVRHCRERGLDARNEDILEHLGSLPDESLGGLVAFQLIEHLDIAGLFLLLRLAARKIRPRGVLILETVNPTCLTTFSGAFYADPTHLRPIHPEAARRMAEIVGFGDTKIEFMNPIGDADKLQYLTTGPNADPTMRKIVETLNQNLRRINSLLYNYADYAVIGRKTV